MNKFLHTAANQFNLNQNPQHNFAIGHSMMLYNKNALYSFIPKNACSTFRLSVAIDNGCIDGIEQGHWIHNNNKTFNASVGEAIKVDYSFVLLRCPFRRLASVYLDKIVGKEPDAWIYHSLLGRKVGLNNLSFRDFVLSLKVPRVLNSNIHWRQQSAFLIYQRYSDYFSLEQFPSAVTILKKKIDFNVVDARSLTNHGTDAFKTIADKYYADHAAFEIAIMKWAGECPSHQSLYDEELINIVRALYKPDIELYVEKFGAGDLLFPN